MKIEHLFADLERRTSKIFAKIRTAITDGLDHIDIVERDIHVLFKFMNISPRRSKQYRDAVKNPYRENDFMFQRLFEAARKSGQSSDPHQFWLDNLLYLLETSHKDLLADAKKINSNAIARTYKHFTESYGIQIWKAADGYEFFLNERLVDFEGDTESVLGVEVKETGPQLIWMTTEDQIHLILPISPDVAIIFCNESRCWDSPFADIMHQLKTPYPQNSLLCKAPHKDITNIDVPEEKRRKGIWPATIAWQVNIGTLSREHHRIITSFSLSHAESFIIVRSRARFERAKRELEVFGKKQAEEWKAQGIRFGPQESQRRTNGEHEQSPPSQERVTRNVDRHMSALEEMLHIIKTTNEPLQLTKDNMFKSWLAVRAIESYRLEYLTTSSAKSDDESAHFGIMHLALKASFEADYPPKHPDHRDLITIDFREFFSHSIGEGMFARLATKIDSKMSALVCADTFKTHWEAVATTPQQPFAGGPLLQTDEGLSSEGPSRPEDEEDLLRNPAVGSICRAAQGFDVLKWMFEERQDILATFVQQIAGPVEDMQPRFVRVRARRE